MLTLGLTGRIWICVEPQDGRKSFDGLAAVVASHMARDPLSGDLYVFRNRRGDRLNHYRKRMLKYRDKLFTFLDHDGVPWNNVSVRRSPFLTVMVQ